MRHLSIPYLLGLLLVTLITSPLKAQSILRAEADSLLRQLQVGKPDTNRVNQLIRLGEYQVYKPGEFKADMDSAGTYAQQAQDLSHRLRYYQGEGRSLNLLGTISREAKELEQSVAYHQAAIRLYRQHHHPIEEAGSYLLLAWAWRDKGDAVQARKEVKMAITLYTKKGYPKGVGQAYLELGNTYANWGEELKEKISYYQQGLQWFARAKDKKKQADVHKDLGDLYQLQGSNAQALLELRKALALYQSIHHQPLQGVYDLLGTVSTSMGDYQEGLKYGLQAVKTAEALKDTTLQLCTIYNRLGLTYYYLKQYEKAQIYFNKAMVVAQKYNDLPSIKFLTLNLADVLYNLGQTEASIQLLLITAKRYPPQNMRDSISLASHLLVRYTTLKQYAPAQGYCNLLLSLSSRLGKYDFERLITYNTLVQFLIASKQHGQARKYLAEYEEYCKHKNFLKAASNIQLYWFRLDSLQGNYPSAIRHYQLYKRLEDSLLNETKSRQLASLDVLYETEKKEQDLKLKEQNIKVLTKEKQLQAKQIEQDKLVRTGIIGGSAMLLLLLGVLYNRYRLKRRSNRLLQAQQRQLQIQHQELQFQQKEINQKNVHLSELLSEKDSLLVEQERLLKEKERLLKEIHHRVKNNLQIVMSLLNSQAASLQDKAALSAIQESQNRVQAMALIHQKLYQAEGIARIPMKAYIEEVVAYLSDSYCSSQPVSFNLEVENIELDVTQAVPLGLIINEAVTNAFKYAFPDGRRGKICLSLHRLYEHTYELSIADDGVGLPQDFDPSRSRSLGMTLLHGFSAQLEGELSLANLPGLNISLIFQEEQLVPAHISANYR